MANTPQTGTLQFEKSGKYRIEVIGYLDDHWSDRLAGMQISTSSSANESTVTTLIGHLRDQAQLSGVLNSLYDLHLPLLLVEFLEKNNGV